MRRLLVFAVLLVACHLSCAAQDTRQESARKRAWSYISEHRRDLGIDILSLQLKERCCGGKVGNDYVFYYDQYVDNVKVFLAGLVAHVRSDRIDLTDGLFRDVNIGTKPAIGEQEAIGAAVQHLKLKGPYEQPDVHVVIVPKGVLGKGMPSSTTLAYEVEISVESDVDGALNHQLLVDAKTGEVLRDANVRRGVSYYQHEPTLRGCPAVR